MQPACSQPTRKVPLFWAILCTFVLVIGLGICGMLGFFGLAARGLWHSDGSEEFWWRGMQVEALADYYVTQGHSWRDLDQHLAELSLKDSPYFPITTVVDQHGRVVASRDPRLRVGQIVDQRILAQGIDIRIENEHVGVALLRGSTFAQKHPQHTGPPPFFRPLLRSLLTAGSALALVLLTLAAVFARWLTRPLRHLTTAAQTLAVGNLDVQVPGARIRELNDLADAFNSMARALAEADRQRRQLTADVAHELRTPLAIMKGRLEGLQDGVYQATPEQIERLLSEAALLERMIEDLRLLALAEAGQLPLYPEPVAPHELLEDAALAFADQARAQHISLCVQAAVDLPMINVDPQRMNQVLANLITNALRYTPAGGRITLCAEAGPVALSGTDGMVLLRVQDTGVGIATADLPRMFDRFWRADRARTRGSGGSGLGLAIVRQIVVAHGGTIQAESVPGNGTTLSICLPTGQQPQSSQAQSPKSATVLSDSTA